MSVLIELESNIVHTGTPIKPIKKDLIFSACAKDINSIDRPIKKIAGLFGPRPNTNLDSIGCLDSAEEVHNFCYLKTKEQQQELLDLQNHFESENYISQLSFRHHLHNDDIWTQTVVDNVDLLFLDICGTLNDNLNVPKEASSIMKIAYSIAFTGHQVLPFAVLLNWNGRRIKGGPESQPKRIEALLNLLPKFNIKTIKQSEIRSYQNVQQVPGQKGDPGFYMSIVLILQRDS